MMDNKDNDICECQHFDEGDWVVCRLNGAIFGIVVGEYDFGRFYNVCLVDTLEIKPFHGVTLRHMDLPDDEPPETARADNVVHVDFKKRRPMTVDSNTEGAA